LSGKIGKKEEKIPKNTKVAGNYSNI